MGYKSNATLSFLATNSPVDVLLPPITQVAIQAAKQTVTLPIQTNWCYLFWSLLMQGTGGAITSAMIQEIRVKVNGILLHQYSGAQLDSMNQFYKYPAGANPDGAHANDFLLLIPFIRQNMRGANQWIDFTNKAFGQATIPDVEWETALNAGAPDPTTGIAITQILWEIDFVNTNAGGVTAIAFQTKAKVLPADQMSGPGALMFINKTTINTVNGINTIFNGNGLLAGDINHYHLDALFLFPPAGGIDQHQFWLNSQEVFQRLEEENKFWTKAAGVRVPLTTATGMCVIDFCETGFADGVKYIAPQATNVRWQFNDTVAEATPILQRSIGYLG